MSKLLTNGVLAALALAATQTPAGAHVALVDSVPAKRQEVMHEMPRIRLIFSGKADALYSTVALADEKGRVLAEATQKEASHEMTLPPQALSSGAYQIRYRVLATDGDVVEGRVDFVVSDMFPSASYQEAAAPPSD
ncbi:copper resistance CopC family protein [Methylocystis parvus]|uniref:Copper resistance protein CopC n=1 Tax=Methylocystis parvus TaxID=134 RepID=A0A6B8M287_9HYPH|nr:copper resistance CopC family protein [Methylocystis parvus]QGM98967.1 copper resistance protein CopC [Methylocystis parvus]WBK00673.1 copper resistance protein CopC [Methylocystis parvus OBBP]